MSSRNKTCKTWANRYVSLGRIGSGSYGTVFKVKDNQVVDIECIKVLKEIRIEKMEEDEIQECLREGKILSKLQHVGIVQFFDSFRLTDYYCIVTEFCDGGDLNQIIKRFKEDGRHFEEKRILRWFIQIIQALNFIHRRKVLHRDLKARNIFLKNDSVKIGDFGISRILNCTMDMASTFVGTPYYMSPEVLKHDGYNTQADIWSAGVILYEMCAQKHAFEGEGIMDVMVKIVDGPCPVIPDHYSKDVQSLIENILIKDPNNRPTAHDILQFPFIAKAMREPWMNMPTDVDVDDLTLLQQTEDIHSYISKTFTVEMLDETIIQNTLTPKQRLEQKKREKADKEAEEKRLQGLRNYKENKAMARIHKEKSTLDSLPFSNQRFKQSPSLITQQEECYKHYRQNFPMSAGLSTFPIRSNVTDQAQFSFSNTTNPYIRHLSLENGQVEIPLIEAHEELPSKPSHNQRGLYDTEHCPVKFHEIYNCNVVSFNAADVPDDKIETGIYADDFESGSSDSDGDGRKDADELELETGPVKFKDNADTDPFGKKVKESKIETMQKQCLELIDLDRFEKALAFIQKHHGVGNYQAQLRKICQSDHVAFLIDQLYFLNNPLSNVY